MRHKQVLHRNCFMTIGWDSDWFPRVLGEGYPHQVTREAIRGSRPPSA